MHTHSQGHWRKKTSVFHDQHLHDSQHCLLAAVTAFINQIKVYYLLTQIVRCHRRCSGLLVYPTPTVTSNNDNRLIAKTIQY